MAVTEAAHRPAALVKPSGSLRPRITWPLPVPREESKAFSVLLPQQLCSPSGRTNLLGFDATSCTNTTYPPAFINQPLWTDTQGTETPAPSAF